MAKKSGLGRGIDAIWSDNNIEENVRGEVQKIRISMIEPKLDQPRQNFDAEALSQLADSIAANGVLQPILVRASSQEGFYQIIAGERRWRASKQAGLTEIPVIIVEADELKAAQFALIENLQREDLDAWEEAAAYNKLIHDFGLSQEDVAGVLGKSRSAIANSLRLLDLPEEVTELLRARKLTAGHCRALLGLRDRTKMMSLAEKAVNRNLSVREVESAVKTLNRAYLAEARASGADEEGVRVDYLAELETKATSLIGRRLRIQTGKRRRIVSIEYQNDEDLEDLLLRICGEEIIERE
ncbi:MAG: ParB/RepB/Spo0J family partition protein [Clostridia bacterium]|nr:ParB/RepB/Spo0J family partition protein [Clostridia bacterium]